MVNGTGESIEINAPIVPSVGVEFSWGEVSSGGYSYPYFYVGFTAGSSLFPSARRGILPLCNVHAKNAGF